MWVVFPLLPLVVASVAMVGRDWTSTGDWAIAELVTGDVFSPRPPLLGAYSRFGWNHPGPVLWWMLAPFYEISGRQGWSLLVGVGLWNSLFLAVAMAFARRISRTYLAAVATAALVMILVVDVNRLVEPWNPLTALTPFFALLVVGTSCLTGDRRAAVVALGLVSVVVQMHVGYAVVVVPVVVVAVWALLRSPRQVRVLIVAVVSQLVLWAPAVVDLVRGEGNLVRIVDSLSWGGDPAGVGVALGVGADALALGLVSVPAVLGVGLFVACTSVGVAVGRRHGLTLPTRSLVLLSAQVVVGVVATARITGEVHDWLVLWWIPTMLLWWGALGWVFAVRVASWSHRRTGGSDAPMARVRVAVGVLLIGLCVAAVVARPPGRVPDPAGLAPAVDAATPAVADYVAAARDPVELGTFGPDSGWVGDGLGAQLAKRDLPFSVADEGINRVKWRPHRITPVDTPAERRLWVITGRGVDHLDRVLALLPGAGSYGVVFSSANARQQRAGLIDAEERLFERLERDGRSDLVRDYLGGDDPAALDGSADLRHRINRLRDVDHHGGVVVIGSCPRGARCAASPAVGE